jgi:cysteine desulfuration protein SufE
MTLPALDDITGFFSFADGWEEKYGYVIELGKKLPPMPAELKNDTTKVRGCVSQVWLWAEKDETTGNIHWQGDSDASIVKGLVAILLAAIQDKPAEEIRSFDAKSLFIDLGLGEHLSPSRSNGFFAMVERIRALTGQQTIH